MKILVTGGTGYIGSHTAVELIDAGHEVVLLDNLSNSSRKVISRIKELTGVNPVFVEGDITDDNLLNKVFLEHDFDAVMHFAAYKSVGESVSEPLKYYRNNIDGLLCILEAMEEFKVHQLIFSSSCTIYGNSTDLPLNEITKTTIDLPSPYGKTKAMAEQILNDAALANLKLKVTSLRYFNPVGAHPSGLIGEDPAGTPECLLPRVAQLATGRLKELKVFGDDYPTPDGSCIRDYLHVVDLAKAHVLALNSTANPGSTNVYNLGTGKGSSVFEVIQAFEKASGKKIPYQIAPRREGDIIESYADPTKAKNELGWQAEKSLDQMCEDVWRWQTKNPDGYK